MSSYSVVCLFVLVNCEILYGHYRMVYQRNMHLCPILDKSREVSHPREEGGGEEEAGGAKTSGCRSMLP